MKDLYIKLPSVRLVTGLKLLVLSILFFTIATSLKPTRHYAETGNSFEQIVPKSFGEWQEAPQLTQVSMVSDERSLVNQLYDDTLMRTYVDREGHQIMVALAYAKEQRQDVKVHQPDVCYPAQGYQMLISVNKEFSGLAGGNPVIGKQQLYNGQNHLEAVSYWIRVGDRTMTSGLQMRLKIIEDGLLKGRLDDGILVRVSSVLLNESESAEAYRLHEKFLAEFVRSVESKIPGLLIPNSVKS